MKFLASSISSANNPGTMAIPILVAGAVAVASSLVSYKLALKKTNNDNDINEEHNTSVQVTLPEWAREELPKHLAKIYKSDEEMMALAIHLSRRNIEENTGGPFGSAIFERNLQDNTATLVSIGMNRVVPLSNSTLHGEMVAIQLAQSRLQNFSMQCVPITTDEKTDESSTSEVAAAKKWRQFELFTSCEPCAMCLGGTLWSGVSRIVCGATKYDAEAIGFDEGPVFEKSYEHLQKAGVRVTKAVLRSKAAKVLEDYGKSGLIYN